MRSGTITGGSPMVDILSKKVRKMKKIFFALVVLLIIPSILYAEESYFLACKDVKITVNNTDLVSLHNAGIIDSQDENITIPFKKGNLFRVAYGGGGWVKTVNKYKEGYPKYEGSFSQFRSECWSDSGEPVCPLEVVFTTTRYKNSFDFSGFLEVESGCWFRLDPEKTIPVKDMKGKDFAEKIGSFFKDRYKDKLVEKTLDEEIVNAMCSPHSTRLSVAGHTFTDIKMEKSEKHLKWVAKDRLHEEARKERIRQEEKAKEEKARIEREEQRILREKEAAKLKEQEEIRRKYGVEKVARIGDLEINPYEYEGRTIAVLVQFKKMLSSTSAIFFSGYTNLRDATGAPDQIIVTGIPKGTHFKGGFMAPKVMLALKGKGTIDGTNAFGARIRAPHFQWVGLIYRE